MKRLIALVVFLVCAVTSVAHAEEGCSKLGVNPVNAHRMMDPKTERAVRVTVKKKVMLTQGGSRPPAMVTICKDEMVIVDAGTGVAKWMVVCGNEVIWPTDWKPENDSRKAESDPAPTSTPTSGDDSGTKKCCPVAANPPPSSGGCGSSCGTATKGVDLRIAAEHPRQDERPPYLPPRTCKCGPKTVKKDHSAVIAAIAILGVLAVGALAMSQNHDHGGGGGWSPAPEPPN